MLASHGNDMCIFFNIYTSIELVNHFLEYTHVVNNYNISMYIHDKNNSHPVATADTYDFFYIVD